MGYFDDLQDKYNDEILYIKQIANVTDDNKIALAVDKANKAICKYCGWDIFNTGYTSALINLSIAYLNNDNVLYSMANGKKQIKSKTEGARTTSYDSSTVNFDSNGLTDSVKSMLPLPKIRVVG